MDALANGEEGRAVGMIGVAATGAPDDSRQSNSYTKKNKPNDEQRPQSAARGIQLKRNNQTWHVDKDNCP